MKNNLGEEFGSFPAKIMLGGLGLAALFHFAGVELPHIRLSSPPTARNECDSDHDGKTSAAEVDACWEGLLSSGDFDIGIKREP